MAKSPKTKQIVARIPTKTAQRIELLARLNSVTTTAVITKLIEIGFGRLPENVTQAMDEEIARQDRQEREEEAISAEVALSRWRTT